MKKILGQVALGCAISILVLSSGCGQVESSAAPETDDVFTRLVHEADQAMASGDAKAAFDLYTDALASDGASDPDGSVAAKQEQAKHLFIARNLLAKKTNLGINNYVAIVVEHSSAETETAEAKRRIHAFFGEQHDQMLKELAQLKTGIKSEEPYKIPLSVIMATGASGEEWAHALTRLDGEFGVQMRRASDLLCLAGTQASKCGDRTWVNEALADVAEAEGTLASLKAHLDSCPPE